MRSREDKRLQIAMGHMLRFGTTIAASIVFVGGALYLVQFHGPVPDYQHFHGASSSSRSLGAMVSGFFDFDSQSVIAFGILVLVATPVCRVLFGVVGFSLQRDRMYAAVSAAVLAILLMGIFARR
ncbi:MAG: DUF1634 domain-containing protein [Edaphobacter sp.]